MHARRLDPRQPGSISQQQRETVLEEVSPPTFAEALARSCGGTALARIKRTGAGYPGNAARVALPFSTEQVAAIVLACSDQGIAIVPHGGNKSLCEGAVPGSG